MDDKTLTEAINRLHRWSEGSMSNPEWIKYILTFCIRLGSVLVRNGVLSIADLKTVLGQKE